jgi:hypothetical protein
MLRTSVFLLFVVVVWTFIRLPATRKRWAPWPVLLGLSLAALWGTIFLHAYLLWPNPVAPKNPPPSLWVRVWVYYEQGRPGGKPRNLDLAGWAKRIREALHNGP